MWVTSWGSSPAGWFLFCLFVVCCDTLSNDDMCRFGHWGHGGGWGHRDYNRWREQDGMLCRWENIFLFSFSTGSFLNRSTQDCTWMDPNLLCQDYEMDFSMTVSNLILSKSTSIYMTVSNLISSLFITVSSFILFKSYHSASQRAWFGGDYMSIIGECECRWNRTFLQKHLLHPIVMW